MNAGPKPKIILFNTFRTYNKRVVREKLLPAWLRLSEAFFICLRVHSKPETIYVWGNVMLQLDTFGGDCIFIHLQIKWSIYLSLSLFFHSPCKMFVFSSIVFNLLFLIHFNTFPYFLKSVFFVSVCSSLFAHLFIRWWMPLHICNSLASAEGCGGSEGDWWDTALWS